MAFNDPVLGAATVNGALGYGFSSISVPIAVTIRRVMSALTLLQSSPAALITAVCAFAILGRSLPL